MHVLTAQSAVPTLSSFGSKLAKLNHPNIYIYETAGSTTYIDIKSGSFALKSVRFAIFWNDLKK